MSVKAAETIHSSTMHLAQELLMNSSGAVGWSGGSRNFAKEMRGLKMRSLVACHPKFTQIN